MSSFAHNAQIPRISNIVVVSMRKKSACWPQLLTIMNIFSCIFKIFIKYRTMNTFVVDGQQFFFCWFPSIKCGVLTIDLLRIPFRMWRNHEKLKWKRNKKNLCMDICEQQTVWTRRYMLLYYFTTLVTDARPSFVHTIFICAKREAEGKENRHRRQALFASGIFDLAGWLRVDYSLEFLILNVFLRLQTNQCIESLK